MSIETKFSEVFPKVDCQSMVDFNLARDVLSQHASAQLLSDDSDTIGTLYDLRALLRASYGVAIVNGLPIHDVISSAMQWPRTLQAFSSVRAEYFKDVGATGQNEFASAEPRADWAQLSDASSWRLGRDFANDTQRIAVALLAVLSDKDSEQWLQTTERLASFIPNLTADDLRVLENERASFRQRYRLQTLLPSCNCGAQESESTRQVANDPVDSTAEVHSPDQQREFSSNDERLGSLARRANVEAHLESQPSQAVAIGANKVLQALAELVGIPKGESPRFFVPVAASTTRDQSSPEIWRELVVNVYSESQRRHRQAADAEYAGLTLEERKVFHDAIGAIKSASAMLLCALLRLRDPRSREIVRRTLKGESDQSIVDGLGVSPATVRRTRNSIELDAVPPKMERFPVNRQFLRRRLAKD